MAIFAPQVDAIRNGTALVLEYRKQRKYEPAILDAAAKLLKVVPEIYTLWNYRREALAPVFEAGGSAAQAATLPLVLLLLLLLRADPVPTAGPAVARLPRQACLTENPKSYSAWHHRKWVVAQGHASLERELQIISRALDEDQRNFHAWNYRQFVCRRMGRSAEDELPYVEEKIVQNFSNYSAWHFRTILLHSKYCGGGGEGPQEGGGGGDVEAGPACGPPTLGPGAAIPGAVAPAGAGGTAGQRNPIPHEVLDQEYDMVHQAFATDSRDESPWVYYRWLIGNTLAHLGPEAAAVGAAGAGAEGPGRGEGPPAAYANSEGAAGVTGPAAGPRAAPPASADAGASAAGREGDGTDGDDDGGGGEAAAEREASRALVAAVLEREAGRLLADHLAAEPDAKWPLLTLARLREAQARLGLGGSAADCEALLAEARSIYGRLMVLDPLRRGYYQDAIDGRAFVVVQALGTV
ncbi:hypothetical protein GPECTOR_4g829 [Gonium pectorale]|uniref:Geranylgeranyl transferase type-2 subunit alpha n=1 Tax=Gonium pectorale TaxID=33097 RepID=A0A150GY48_GONPE|nr:hypothetical protein GPECTOR_4g829 [Gonium pectorale]|eukprot:KXZ54759.1 hypothetical protein GPECTOR_4g829 [Gonium pectorale]